MLSLRMCEIATPTPACPFVPAQTRTRQLSLGVAAAILALSGVSSSLALAQNDAKPAAAPATVQPATESTDTTSQATTEPIELAWKFEKDTPLKLKDTQEIIIAATGMMAMNMNITVTTYSNIEFSKVNEDGSAEATLNFKRIITEGQAKLPQMMQQAAAPGDDGKFYRDTLHPEKTKAPKGGMMGPDSDGLEAFDSMIDKPIKFKVTKTGIVSDVSGTQAITDKMVAAASAKPAPEWAANNPDMAAQMKQHETDSIRKTFSDATMKNIIEEMFRVVPEKATKLKTNWSRPSFGPGMISAIMQGQGGDSSGTVNNSIVDYTDSTATIKTATALTFKAEHMPEQMDIKPLQGTGEIVFDNESGALIESTNDLKTTITQTIPAFAEGMAEQKMIIEIGVKTRVEPIVEE